MKTLSIDIETYSSVDLKTSGVYAYTQAPDFEILMMAYAYDDDPVQLIDLTEQVFPLEMLESLLDPAIIKTAYNANFERTCLAEYLKVKLEPESWRCTAVLALTLGLPGHLDGVAKAMKLDVQKDAAGKNLIRYFSIPCKPTDANGQRTRNLPEHAPDKWEAFKSYCGQDVEVERAIRKKLERFQPTDFENKLWELDQRINDRGVLLDPVLVEKAIQCDAEYKERLQEEAVTLTGLDNPNSVAQLKAWLEEEKGETVDSLTKATVSFMIKSTDSETVKRVLELRQELSKTSVKKYIAMERAMCRDNRARGLLQFYGAGRTGRWAGRLVQVQNLPQNKLDDLDTARQLLRSGDFETLEMLYDKVPFVLSQLIRTAFIPSAGCRFIVSDFSAIEARVIAWLAGEQWRQDVFATHGKIYEASASQMFRVPIEQIGKGSPLRQKGKVAELALGYQGGKGALLTMGALNMGLKEEELPGLVKTWRAANPAIVKLWKDCETAALTAVKEKTSVSIQYGVTFLMKAGILFIQLPSGRKLAYAKPRIEPDPNYGRDQVTYEGTMTQGGWGRMPTYGGKLVENIVQAIARDCLAESMVRLDENGYQIVMHVHDEVVLEVPNGTGSIDHVAEIMGQPIEWAQGLLLTADGYETDYYKKD